MNASSVPPLSRSARPFGAGLRDADLRLVVASSDVRYRQKLRAAIVRRSTRDDSESNRFAAELIVLNTPENIEELQAEARGLDPHHKLQSLPQGDIVDTSLISATTGERVMFTAVGPSDFSRVEQIVRLEQIHIGGLGDRGSWVCRIIDAERLDALFSGRLIDIRADAS